MGNAEARDLDLQGITLYNAKDNYRRAKGEFLDWTGHDAPMIRSTRTVATPAQDAAIIAGDDASVVAPK
jgi:outer membrane protein